MPTLIAFVAVSFEFMTAALSKIPFVAKPVPQWIDWVAF
jgi:hypothetical protein